MAGAPQYNYPPPPPGPPQHQPSPQQYNYGPPPQFQHGRGGGSHRGGRDMGGGRGGFQPAPFPHQQPQQYGPPHGQQSPQNYNAPPPHQQNHGPYIGPQAHPPPQHQGPPHGGFQQPPHWQNGPQHGQPPMGHPPQHGPQPPVHAVPLQAANYHPNYAPQHSPQPQQLGPPQHQSPYQNGQPQYGPPQHHSPHAGSPQWQPPPQHGQPHFNNRARGGGGRGGFGGNRGGHEAPLMGPPIRMGFDNRGGPPAQAGPGFPQPYPPQPTPPPHFVQPYTPGYSPHFPQAGQSPPFGSHPHSASHRGRGGNVNNFRGRSRQEFSHANRGRDHRNPNNGGHKHNDQHNNSAGADANGKKKKKRRTNTLGLTPNGADHEDSGEEDNDDDEELRLVTMLGAEAVSLPPDIDVWLQERKKKFPTKARREAAEAEMRIKRAADQANKAKAGPAVNSEKLEKQQRKADKLRAELKKAERVLNSLGGKRKRETGDEGDDGVASDDISDDPSAIDSGAEPETMSSRHAQGQSQLPKPQLQIECKYFSTGGTCGKKGKCRFIHNPETRNQALRDKQANGGKMTLAQRLYLNDAAKGDLTILKAIRYLKDNGALSGLGHSANTNVEVEDDEMVEHEQDDYEENLTYGN